MENDVENMQEFVLMGTDHQTFLDIKARQDEAHAAVRAADIQFKRDGDPKPLHDAECVQVMIDEEMDKQNAKIRAEVVSAISWKDSLDRSRDALLGAANNGRT